jgi:hypothetical protein
MMHHRRHPGDRPPKELGVGVAVASLGMLSKDAWRNTFGVPAFSLGGGIDPVHKLEFAEDELEHISGEGGLFGLCEFW